MTNFYCMARRYYSSQDFVVGKANIFTTRCIIRGGLYVLFCGDNAVVGEEFTIIFLFSSGSG